MAEEHPASVADSSDVCDANRRTSLAWMRWAATWGYLVLSGCDILFTYQLLVTQKHVEANPLARFFIDGWGLKGMVWFKLSMTAFVLSLVHALLQKREDYARMVIRLGAVIVFGVDCYSVWLLTGG